MPVRRKAICSTSTPCATSQSNADDVSIVILGKIYKSLEDCCAAFKDVTKFVEEIALKYA